MRRLLPAAALAVLVCVLAASAAARVSASQLRLQPVAQDFDEPVLVTATPADPAALYVVEQGGTVIRLAGGKRTTFLDLSPVVTAGGEQGLLGLAFHPKYASNKRLFVGYTSKDGRNVVAELRAPGGKASPGSRKVLFSVRDPYGNHNGGHVAFGPDGKLYTTIGDGGSGDDPENRSQTMSSPFGKLQRIDVDRRPVRVSIAALGLRNAWRFSFDRTTGDLWLGDVGQGSIEEIDFLPAGSTGLVNFGWDVYEGRSEFEQKSPGPGRLVFPIAQYTHGDGCSVTGGYVYRGTAVPAAKGRYFFGDYCSGAIWSMKQAGGKAVGLRREPFSVKSITSFGEDARGELYAVSQDGTIYRLTR